MRERRKRLDDKFYEQSRSRRICSTRLTLRLSCSSLSTHLKCNELSRECKTKRRLAISPRNRMITSLVAFIILVSQAPPASSGEAGIKIKTNKNFDDISVQTVYRTMVGSKVDLPCDTTVPSSEDSITLILWYKGDRKSAPIYSVDARSTPVDKAKHFVGDGLKHRAKLDIVTSPSRPGSASLHIDPIKDDDGGVYLCRVDFKWARTINTVTNLSVIVPPKQVIIADESGIALRDLIGPFEEGSHLRLLCQAIGGSPPPRVVWLRDGQLIDDSFSIPKGSEPRSVATSSEKIHDDQEDAEVSRTTVTSVSPASVPVVAPPSTSVTVVNELSLEALSRGHLFSVLTCQASNTNLTNPVSTFVSLDINLKPLDVQIVSFKRALQAGRRAEVICQSRGSRPPAALTWFLGKTPLTSSVSQSFSDDGNMTTSVLNLVPSADSHGTYLTCQAENPQLQFTWSRVEDILGQDMSHHHRNDPEASPPGHDLAGSAKTSTSFQGNDDVSGAAGVLRDGWQLNVYFPPQVDVRLTRTKSSRGGSAQLGSSTPTPTPGATLAKPSSSSSTSTSPSSSSSSSEANTLNRSELLSKSSPATEAQHIKEGDEVVIECRIKANPAVSEINWFANKEPLVSDPLKGLIVSNSSLIIRVVRRHHIGHYKCSASNPEGRGESPTVDLIVQYAPVCDILRLSSERDEHSNFGSSGHGTVSRVLSVSPKKLSSVVCRVSAVPKDISFFWTFNGTEITSPDKTARSNVQTPTGQSVNLASVLGQFKLETREAGLESVLHFTPSSSAAFGTLACWAKNSVGAQLSPCLFSIIPENPPEPVEYCEIRNQTWESIHVECLVSSSSSVKPKLASNLNSQGGHRAAKTANLTNFGDQHAMDSSKSSSSSTSSQAFVSSPSVSSAATSSSSYLSGSEFATYHLELYNSEQEHLLANVTNAEAPSFSVNGLSPGATYVLVIYSANSRGKSNSVVLTSSTLSSGLTARKPDYFYREELIDSQLLIIAMAVSALLLLSLLLMILIILKIRKRDVDSDSSAKREKSVNLKTSNSRNSSRGHRDVQEVGGELQVHEACPYGHRPDSDRELDIDDYEDGFRRSSANSSTTTNGAKNPDVIPIKRDSYGNLTNCSSGYSASGQMSHQVVSGHCPSSDSYVGGPLATPTIGHASMGVIGGAGGRMMSCFSAIKPSDGSLPHVTVIDTRPQSKVIITAENNVFTEEMFEEPHILSLSTAV